MPTDSKTPLADVIPQEPVRITGKSLKVLLVDDDPEFREGTSEKLVQVKCAVVTASNGREALDRYQESPDFDVIVTDLFMPEMDGIELIEYFSGQRVPKLIALSSTSPEGIRLDEAATKVGAWRVVERGSFDALDQALGDLLHGG